MQPNKNLVFYLAGDDEEVNAVSAQPHAAPVRVEVSAVTKTAEHKSDADGQVAVLGEHADDVPSKVHEEVDWIATLENIRHQRRVEPDDVGAEAEPKAFAKQDAPASVLKVTSMKTTELYQPAASALASGKDLDRLSYSLKEAQRLVKNTPATEYHAPKATEAPVWSMEDLEAQIQSLGDTSTHTTPIETDVADVLADEVPGSVVPASPLDDLKAAAKQVPFDEFVVAASKISTEPSQELIDKANEVAEKTALSLEERHKILDGFLSLWQHKREPDVVDSAERKVMFKEEWQAHNSEVLQSAAPNVDAADQVLWMKTQAEVDHAADTVSEASEPVISDIVVTEAQPEEANDRNMYAPVHVHIVTPDIAASERLSVVSEKELLTELAAKLKPYFVDMLAGLVRNELNRQTTALVQRLQDNIQEEIPMLVDDVLQENLLNVLRDIKQSHHS